MQLGLMNNKKREVARVELIPLDKVVSNPNQPRKYFDQSSLQELCRSIITNGLLQPVNVRELPDGSFELIAGERRTMAFRILGRDSIPAIVEDFTDEQSAVLALVENLQRKDLNYFEEAAGIARLMQELCLTQVQVSQKLGKAQSTIANKLRLLKYPPEIQRRMLESGLTERHARALLKVTDPQTLEMVVEYVVANKLNVEATEQYIKKLFDEQNKPKASRLFVIKDIRIFLNTVNKAIDLMKASGIPVNMKKSEDDAYLEYVLRIPKTAAYRSRAKQPDSKQMIIENV